MDDLVDDPRLTGKTPRPSTAIRPLASHAPLFASSGWPTLTTLTHAEVWLVLDDVAATYSPMNPVPRWVHVGSHAADGLAHQFNLWGIQRAPLVAEQVTATATSVVSWRGGGCWVLTT